MSQFANESTIAEPSKDSAALKAESTFTSKLSDFVPNRVYRVGSVVKHEGYGVSETGEYVNAKPPLWQTPTTRSIRWSDAKAIDPVYDWIKYALDTAGDTIPPSCIVSRRNCLRKFYKLFCNLRCDDFVIDVSKNRDRIFLGRTESHDSIENFGKPFERLCTVASRDQASYHCINEFPTFLGDVPLVVCCETDAVENGHYLELKTKYNKPGKKGRQYPMTKSTIRDQAYYDDEFKDHCGQMFFGNVVALRIGIIEGQDKGSARIASIDNWTFQEVQQKAFGNSQGLAVALDKIASLLLWIRSKLASDDDVNATLTYSGVSRTLTLRITAVNAVLAIKAASKAAIEVELDLSLDGLSLVNKKKTG